MVATCKGMCVYSQGPVMGNKERYGKGQKRCTNCSLFLDTPDARCPCCKTILRTKARNRVSRQRRTETNYQ
ncbi:hypothetical protein K0U27_04625 [archaeon]|nr:hypothetical protein [archaeon]